MTEPFDIKVTLDFSLDWTAMPKTKLEDILEQSLAEEKFPQVKLEDDVIYKHLIHLDLQDAANEVLEVICKRYMLLRRTLSDDNKTKLDETLKESLFDDSHSPYNSAASSKLKLFLNKEKIAAYNHIKNSLSSLPHSLVHGISFGREFGIQILRGGLIELYSGEKRFFSEKIKTRSEVAKEGGLARQNRHLATKQKACELLNKLMPHEGWAQELDAYKSILPELKKYMEINDIRNPARGSIDRTLRRWIKDDPLVSAAVRIAQSTIYDETV